MRGRLSLREIARVHGLPESLLKRVAGGEGLEDTAAVASYMGVPQATVRRWRGKGKTAGVPPERLARLAEFVADREAVAKQEAAERRKLKKLVTRARKAGVLPRAKPRGTRRFGGARATGVRTTHILNQYLKLETLDEIERLVMSAPKAERYIVNIMAVEGGITDKVQGYRAKYTKQFGPANENIAWGSVITSGSWTSRKKTLESLFAKLYDSLNDIDSIMFLTELTVFSYEYKEKHKKFLRQRGEDV